MNKVTRAILAAFERSNMDGAYVATKRERIEVMNELESLEWATRCLDAKHRSFLAEELNITLNDIEVVKKVFAEIW